MTFHGPLIGVVLNIVFWVIGVVIWIITHPPVDVQKTSGLNWVAYRIAKLLSKRVP